jgi:nickel-dependent lactate racemase
MYHVHYECIMQKENHMHTIELPFGNGKQTVHISERNLAGVITLAPKKRTCDCPDPAAIVREALDNPIGSKKLSELAVGKKKIVIITSDHTRAVPVR